jgi:hypothetical protein
VYAALYIAEEKVYLAAVLTHVWQQPGAHHALPAAKIAAVLLLGAMPPTA